MPTQHDDPAGDRFQGYTSPNYTQVPDELFDRQLPDLSGAELKVLLYVMRRTFGFKKDADDISLNQICRGITTRDGRVLDRGTGLSKSTAQLAIKGLLEKNIILTTKRVSKEKGNEATTYELNVPSRRPYTENRHNKKQMDKRQNYRISIDTARKKARTTGRRPSRRQWRSPRATSDSGTRRPGFGKHQRNP